VIRTMRNTVYSLKAMKDIIKALEQHSVEKTKTITREALESLNHRNQTQMLCIRELYRLCEVIGLVGISNWS
jgi:DNA-binding transcriptional MerR regulator